MVSLPKLMEQANALNGKIQDESAVEAIQTVLKSKKNRATMAARLRELAGTNRAQGAEILRIAAWNIEHGFNLAETTPSMLREIRNFAVNVEN